MLPQVIIETQGELLLRVLQMGTVSTNVYLRRLHNFCVDMNWLPWPLIPKRQWPAVRFKDKRAITWEEHCRIVAREMNPERKAFYQLAWHLGASQSDLAHLQAEDVDWQARIICFVRMKTRWRGQQPPQIRFGKEVEEILATFRKSARCFRICKRVRAGDRATEFKQRCVGLGIQGVSLHSYRYAWAERAKICGYPERFAQLALGHNSKAVHRAYAKKAQVTLPPLEEFEKQMTSSPRKRMKRGGAGKSAIKDRNFDCIRNLRVAETRPEHFDRALADGKVSTNVYLRRIHNHALGMEWLLKSVIPRLQWPKPVFKTKRAITAEEHAAIVAREQNAERRDFYELLWHTGASQTDAACLLAEDVDWNSRTISYSRARIEVARRDGHQAGTDSGLARKSRRS